MDVRPTWTDCDEARDCVVPNVISPRDLVTCGDDQKMISIPGVHMTLHLEKKIKFSENF